MHWLWYIGARKSCCFCFCFIVILARNLTEWTCDGILACAGVDSAAQRSLHHRRVMRFTQLHHLLIIPDSCPSRFLFFFSRCCPVFHSIQQKFEYYTRPKRKRRRRRRARWDVLLVCKPHDRFGTCSCVGSFVNHILWIRYEIYPVLFCIHNNIAMRCGGETTTTTRPLTVGKKKTRQKGQIFLSNIFFSFPLLIRNMESCLRVRIYSKRECHTVKSQHRTIEIRQRAGKKKKCRTGNLFWHPTRECRWFVIFGAVHNSGREKRRRIRLGGGALPIMVARLTSRRRTVTHTHSAEMREMTLYYPYVITWVNLM